MREKAYGSLRAQNPPSTGAAEVYLKTTLECQSENESSSQWYNCCATKEIAKSDPATLQVRPYAGMPVDLRTCL